MSQVGDKREKAPSVAGDRDHSSFRKQYTENFTANTREPGPAFHVTQGNVGEQTSESMVLFYKN